MSERPLVIVCDTMIGAWRCGVYGSAHEQLANSINGANRRFTDVCGRISREKVSQLAELDML